MLPETAGSRTQHLDSAEVSGMSSTTNNVSNAIMPSRSAAEPLSSTTSPTPRGLSPRKVLVKAKSSSVSREEASVVLPPALEGVHWRREEAPAHSKSGSAVTRCLMLTDPSCITFSRRNYLEDHFRIVHQLFPSKPRVGRKKISNKPSRCISPSARERMADHMQGDFPFKFWKAKKKRFVMSTTKAKHMWSSVEGHEKLSNGDRRDWIWQKATEFYKTWREGPLAVDTMVNLANHVVEYWHKKGVVNEEEVAQKGRIPQNYDEFISDEEYPSWEINKDGREICKRRLKSKAIENKPMEALLEGRDGSRSGIDTSQSGGGRPDLVSDEEKEGSTSTGEKLPSVEYMEVLPNEQQGVVAGEHSGPPAFHDSVAESEVQQQEVKPHNCSVNVLPSGTHGSFTDLLNIITTEKGPGSHQLVAVSTPVLGGEHAAHQHHGQKYER